MDMGFQFLNEWMNLADFSHANTYSGNLLEYLVIGQTRSV